MSTSESLEDGWEEIDVTGEGARAEGRPDNIFAESSRDRSSSQTVSTANSARTTAPVDPLSVSSRQDCLPAHVNRDEAWRIGEEQCDILMDGLNTSILDETGDAYGGEFYIGRGTNSEPSSGNIRQSILLQTASPGMWAGRPVSSQSLASGSLMSTESPGSGGGWNLPTDDHRGLAEAKAVGGLDLGEPAASAAFFCKTASLVPDVKATQEFLPDTGTQFVDRPGISGNPMAFTFNRLRQCRLNNAVSLFGSSVPSDRLAEGTQARLNLNGRVPASQISPPAGEAVDMEGCETDGDSASLPQRGVRSMLRGPEKLHKRAKFLQSLPTQRHHSASTSNGSSLLASTARSASPLRSEQGGQQLLPMVRLPSSSSYERGTPEPDNAGGGDNGDDDEASAEDAKDANARMDLTDDLLHKVFSFLDDTSLCQAAMVCRQWRVASAHEDFWKTLNFENRRVSHEQVGVLCLRYPNATTLNLKGAPCVDETLVRDAMRSLRNLEVLKLSRGTLSEGFFYALATECSALQHLSISDAMLGNGGAQEIQLRHESLRRLQIYKCRVVRIAIRCPQLDWLSLRRTGTASAMLHCPRLVTLDVSSCHKLSDAGVRAAATACPLLASLDMSNCAYVSDETLREISMMCTNLRILDASYCPNISLEGVRMPMLIELKLHGCEGIISSSMAALSTCAMLEDLQLDFCWLLTAISLDLPRLRQISLSSNRKVVELTLRSPALTKLNLNNCPILSRIDINSSSLQSLVLRQQNGLSTMALQCARLQEVDLSECENLTDAVCDVFSDGGGCPKLGSLILDNCEGLNHVNLASTSLRKLSLVGCQNIASLKLVCPFLQQLHLDGCDHLTEASFAPVGLLALNLGICPHLVTLQVEAAQMTSLDLRGCGVLSRAVFRCPSLMSLDASYCSQLGDDCLDETTSSCPAIQSLVLASCPSVEQAGLLALKRLKDLTMLDLSYTFLTDLSPIFEACPGLKVLRLSACKYLGETALDALHGGKVLPKLRELDLSYGSLGTSAIEGVMALCPHLSHVSLNGCVHVTDVLWARLSLPRLAEVALEDIGMEDTVLSDLVYACKGNPGEKSVHGAISGEDNVWMGVNDRDAGHEKKLAYVNFKRAMLVNLPVSDPVSPSLEMEAAAGRSSMLLDSEIVMHSDVAHVRALQNLSCVGCPHINKVVIPRYAACLHLSSLNLSLSVNIREVSLSCPNLTSLNLSNCAGLVVLKLDCPRLMSLFLQACGIEVEMLEFAILGCDVLETLDVRNCSKVSSVALTRMRSVCPGLKRLYSTMST